MNYNELKKFVENIKYHKYWTGGGKGLNEHKDLSMDEDFDLIKSMDNKKEFVVKDSSVEFLCNMIPERFIKNEQIVFTIKVTFGHYHSRTIFASLILHNLMIPLYMIFKEAV